jgi:hypothetical protein
VAVSGECCLWRVTIQRSGINNHERISEEAIDYREELTRRAALHVILIQQAIGGVCTFA